ncbi:uncharacterized protein EI90DRAFT_3056436 [Cantharellus anzutake]|uniref:uncharacterized protein n=1 Tax=Cantharellus anzutake TaxID=1750568 RepID=UPI001903AF38|nr:uncharacterized protein EI90DRAFT_3056436 [Cantharellus anzutake]KAF8332066.1 hypothetical protein EI90DRAFT_3056436 [Cantharellus anzutake]
MINSRPLIAWPLLTLFPPLVLTVPTACRSATSLLCIVILSYCAGLLLCYRLERGWTHISRHSSRSCQPQCSIAISPTRLPSVNGLRFTAPDPTAMCSRGSTGMTLCASEF